MFLLLIKRLLPGDALSTITDHRFFLQIYLNRNTKSRFTFNCSFYCTNQCHQLKCSFLNKNNKMFANIIRSFRSVVARVHNFTAIPSHHYRTPYIAPPPHSVTPFRHFAAYPHTSSHHTHHIMPHHIRNILTHQTRPFRRTVPAHFVPTYNAVQLQNGVQLRNEFSCKTGYSVQTRG